MMPRTLTPPPHCYLDQQHRRWRKSWAASTTSRLDIEARDPRTPMRYARNRMMHWRSLTKSAIQRYRREARKGTYIIPALAVYEDDVVTMFLAYRTAVTDLANAIEDFNRRLTRCLTDALAASLDQPTRTIPATQEAVQ